MTDDQDAKAQNWTRTTNLIWEADDAELALIIAVVTEFEQHHGRVISAHELRAQLKRPGT